MVALRDSSFESALAAVQRILADPDPFNPDFEKLDLGGWATIHVEIPEPDLHSMMTPPFMEAFLELQKQVYQLAALAKTGVANTQYLSESDLLELQINVKVTDGSSNYFADLAHTLDGLLKKMIGKMTGKQAATVILGIAVLIAGHYAFTAWLEHQRLTKIDELKTQEHIAALKELSFANEGLNKQLGEVINIVREQGDIGKRAVDAVIATNEALLKAASKTPKVVINDNHLSRNEAELLRTVPKRKPDIAFVKQPVRIIDINTADPKDLQLVLMNPNNGEQHRIKFTDTLFASTDRHKLFEALEKREPIWVELAIRSVQGEVRSVQLLRCVDPPDDLTDLTAELGENDR